MVMENHNIDIQRLRNAMKHSLKALGPFRENRTEALRQYVGNHYSDKGASDKVPVNMIELAINIYMQNLVAQTPQCLISTHNKAAKPAAEALRLDTNSILKQIRFGNALERVVRNALFGVGIAKRGLSSATRPYFDWVSLDNWVCDMTARRWEEMQFCGDRYQLTMEEIQQSDYFTPEFKKSLVPKTEAMPATGTTAAGISGATDGIAEPFMETVELWDIWLPYQRLLITIAAEDSSEIGAIIEWNGPEDGPYAFLTFNDVEDNIMPLPPVALWRDLHELTNSLFRKLGRQANRQKTITAVRGGADADGSRLLNADDGDMIKLDDPKNVQEFKYGGVDQQSLGFLVHVKNLASYMYGNLDIIGGLAAQSETLGQDKLLAGQASKRLESMANRVIDFTARQIRDIAWYRYTDEVNDWPVVKKRFGIDIPTYLYTTQRKQYSFFDYTFNVEPYSLVYQTPAQKLSGLTNIVNTLVAPFAPMLEQQGIAIDFAKLFKLVGDYGNLPELADVVVYTDPAPPRQAPDMPAKAANTTRTYVRENKPAATRQGQDQVLAQLMFGGNPQGSEKAALTRNAG
jgi:hypothetical protein